MRFSQPLYSFYPHRLQIGISPPQSTAELYCHWNYHITSPFSNWSVWK